MIKPLIIGITGGIGGGKSTLAEKLRSEGFEVYDSDKEARILQNEHPVIREKLIELFGSEIYLGNELNRIELGSIVFKKSELLLKLNAIVHPIVKEHFKNWIENRQNQKLLFMESAILFESGFNSFVDKVIVITASEDIRIKRVIKRDGSSVEQVRLRIANQLPEEKKVAKADFIIHSDDKQLLVGKMKKILSQLNESVK
ncbi:MAG: dephospho-CoA kinase [Paludibacter sp.]|nr:dephospho-CoA kinase [Paludibacter sp.]